MMGLTKIELTADEARLFVEFQKRYALVQLLDSVGAFDIKSGSITINFTALGEIISVDKHQHYGPL